jgi:hypothetical protein
MQHLLVVGLIVIEVRRPEEELIDPTDKVLV